jgi:hypothetical protein
MRRLHSAMVEAVLVGDGLGRVAELAAAAARGPVAIVVPPLGVAVGAPDRLVRPRLAALTRHASARGHCPDLLAHAPITLGGEPLGLVGLLDGGDAEPAPDAPAFLRLAAMASLTEVAIGGASDDVELAGRARRLGCDLTRGALVVCSPGPRTAVLQALADVAGALALSYGGRVVALLPGLQEAEADAPWLGERLGAVGCAWCPDPASLPRAAERAELALEAGPGGLAALREATVAPLAHHDELYGGELVGTLATFLAEGCDIRATAAALGAHGHTIVYRLERVVELCGLDPRRPEDRERLALGLRADRLGRPAPDARAPGAVRVR